MQVLKAISKLFIILIEHFTEDTKRMKEGNAVVGDYGLGMEFGKVP